jgi:hypothetical protein
MPELRLSADLMLEEQMRKAVPEAALKTDEANFYPKTEVVFSPRF